MFETSTIRYIHSLVMSFTFQALFGVNALKPRTYEAFSVMVERGFKK